MAKMTMKEIRSAFELKLKLESHKRGVPEITLGDKELMLIISMGVADITNSLKILKDTKDVSVTPVSTYTEYTLDEYYGGLIKAELVDASGNILGTLTEGVYSDVSTGNQSTGTPQRIIIFSDAGQYKAVLQPHSNIICTLRVHYYKVGDVYAPSKGVTQATPADSEQEVGMETTSTTLILPDRYMPLLLTYMIGTVFDEYMQNYELMLRKMRGNDASSKGGRFPYSLGGVSAK